MKQITIAGTSIRASQMGFGCASLGSRVSPAEGLSAISRAIDLGITWFDVAPSYGDGQAEELLGRALGHRRSIVQICTKVGVSPARKSELLAAVKPLARRAIIIVPSLRDVLKRVRPQPRRQVLSAALISSSILESLRRMRTDRVDVLALHDVSDDELRQDEILRALEDVLHRGQALAVSVASSATVAEAAYFGTSPFKIMQFSNHALAPNLDRLSARLPQSGERTFITHSSFQPLKRISSNLRSNPRLRAEFRAAGYDGTPDNAVANFLFDYAIASNSAGIVLMSAFSPHHMHNNVQRLAHDGATALDLARHLLHFRS